MRSTADAEALADPELPSLYPILLDVTSAESVDEAMGQVRDRSPNGLHALVNNAGVGLPSAVELTTPEEFRKLLEVNSIAPLRMIRSCLPLLRMTEGRVINMSSLNGTLASPMVGAYSASKFALEALSDALRVELRPWNIQVSVVAPGQVRTPVFDKARGAISRRRKRIPAELLEGYEPMYAQAEVFNERGSESSTRSEDVAKVVLRALTASTPRLRYRVGWDAYGMSWFIALAPKRFRERVIARMVGAAG